MIRGTLRPHESREITFTPREAAHEPTYQNIITTLSTHTAPLV